jgi:hypothetical protein
LVYLEAPHHLLKYGVLADLCARFSENVHRPVSLVNDAKAWLKGVMTYANWSITVDGRE